jgi:anti-sigma B factor antagonist
VGFDNSEASTVPAFPVVVLNPEGPLTLGKGTDDLRRIVEQHLKDGRNCIILDLRQVPYMDTSGLGELVRCVKRVGELSGKMVLVPGEANHSFLERFRLDMVFDLQPDLPEAYARLEVSPG